MKTWSVQLAHNINDHPITSGEWFTLTQKLNGVRGTFYRGEILGRNGTRYTGLEHIARSLAPYAADYVFDGELTLADPGALSDSAAFRSAAGLVRRKSGDKSNLALTIFDVVPLDEFEGEGRTSYRARREELDKLVSCLSALPGIRILPALYQGCDPSVIAPLLHKMTTERKEGLIANLDTAYQRHRNTGILKIKQFHTMDLPILRCEPGTGELSNTLGSFIVDYQGNEVGVGVGFTRDQRDDFWRVRDDLRGKLVEVKYKEVSENAHGGKSLQFPTFLSLRTDKQDVSYGPANPLRLFDLISVHSDGQLCLAL